MRYFSVIKGAVAVMVLGLAAGAGAQSFEEKAQVTIGGAESRITGWVTAVEDNAIWIQQATGEENRVAINEGTNMICKTRPEGALKAERKPGMGFRIGDCPFAKGDVVKVEISNLGVATLIRYLDEKPISKTAALGLPQKYVSPFPEGKLTFLATPAAHLVRTRDGEDIGHLYGTVVDSKRGMAYAVVVRSHDQHFFPVPWRMLAEKSPGPGAKPVLVLQETGKWIGKIHPPLYEAANLIDMAALQEFWMNAKPPLSVDEDRYDVEVVIRDKAFHLAKGGSEKGFDFLGGSEGAILLRNEDTIAHEFVSTLFRQVPMRFSGNATMVSTPVAAGVRLDPGETVVLRFQVPIRENWESDVYFDTFWCNIHGKDHGAKMRGELLVMETRGTIG